MILSCAILYGAAQFGHIPTKDKTGKSINDFKSENCKLWCPKAINVYIADCIHMKCNCKKVFALISIKEVWSSYRLASIAHPL